MTGVWHPRDRMKALGNGNNEGWMKGYEGLKHPFIMIIAYILMSYIEFMNGEGLTNEFIDIDNYYGYTLCIIIISCWALFVSMSI